MILIGEIYSQLRPERVYTWISEWHKEYPLIIEALPTDEECLESFAAGVAIPGHHVAVRKEKDLAPAQLRLAKKGYAKVMICTNAGLLSTADAERERVQRLIRNEVMHASRMLGAQAASENPGCSSYQVRAVGVAAPNHTNGMPRVFVSEDADEIGIMLVAYYLAGDQP